MANVVLWPEREASDVPRATDWAVAACFFRALVVLLMSFWPTQIHTGLPCVSGALDRFLAFSVTALARGLSRWLPRQSVQASRRSPLEDASESGS